jgi:uncharacterized protein YjeT (DUF2065 family)
MEKQVTAGLKYTFLVHGIMMVIFGLTYLFIPVQWGNLTGCLSNQVPEVFRVFGTTILGLALTSLLAFRETSWDRVQIVAQMERIFNPLFVIVLLLLMLFGDLHAIGWMYFVVMSGFAIAFNVFYLKG